MFKRIDHVELIPKDFEKTMEFYTNILGFKIRERRKIEAPTSAFNELALITLNDSVIELLSAKEPVQASPQPGQIGFRRIALEVEDMDKALAYLKSKGVTILREPASLGRSKRAEIADPSGLSIELCQW